MASKLGSKQQGDQEFDPKYEWQENAANFLLRVHLSGFRKEDFRVQVDGAGRLTVRGQRADGVRFHKVFQLPPTSNLDDISGRFDAGVLNLTVPKRPAPPPPATIQDMIRKPTKQDDEPKRPAPPPPATIQDMIRKPTKQDDEPKPKEEKTKDEAKKPEQHKEADTKKPEENAKTKAEQRKEERQDEAEKRKEERPDEAEQRKKETQKPKEEARKKAADEKVKEKVVEAKPEQERTTAVTKEEAKPKAEVPTETKPADKAVDRESLLERVRRRAEEERAKAAEEAERQRKQSACGGWKERVTEELQGLQRSEWVETVKKNKEVIAAAVAAFSLGLFVSSRLFSRN